MLAKVAGRVRGLYNIGAYPENREEEQFHINTRGDQCVAQGLPGYADLIRLGGSWQGKTTTGVATPTALPTTTAQFTLYNNEAATGKCYLIDSVATWSTIQDPTQSNLTSIFVLLNKGGVSAPSGGTAETSHASLSGRSNYDGAAILHRTATSITNDGWYPAMDSTNPGGGVTAVAGAMWKVIDVPLNGRYLVRPGGAFHMATVQATAGALGQFHCIRWHEVQILWRS